MDEYHVYKIKQRILIAVAAIGLLGAIKECGKAINEAQNPLIKHKEAAVRHVQKVVIQKPNSFILK
ncbi:MAG: hypothetical protein HKK67_14330 [Chlorobiaceae bacterium]|nr:hypothetical protein [Chlorobiaceae bacterium]NMW22766.1 hypothetical protein [Chlorobiaceae bacterium]